MEDITQAAQSIAKLLQSFISAGGLRLRFRVKARAAKPAGLDIDGNAAPAPSDDSSRALYIEFSGPDTPILIANNGEVLNALEHIAAKVLRLEPEEHDRVQFDADHFKANRDAQMRASAEAAIERVRLSGRPHPFPPMNSRERRMLHLILAESGLPTASSGEGPGRFVVLYPEGADTSAPLFASATDDPPRRRPDAARIRETFRHR
jgi:spoIIIJ-associated protein